MKTEREVEHGRIDVEMKKLDIHEENSLGE